MKLFCPQCGAEIVSVEDSGFIKCQYCATTLYVDLTQARRHYYFAVQVEERHLVSILSRWLRARELSLLPRLISIDLFYFPFWQVAKGHQTLFFPAAAIPVQALEKMRSPGGDISLYEAFLEKENQVIPPDIFLDSALEERMDILGNDSRPLQASLIHLPLYALRYQYENGEYEAIIDGVDGQLFADECPPLPQLVMDRFFSLALLLVLALFSAEFYFIPGGIQPLIAALITALPTHFVLKSLFLQRRW